MNKKEIERQLKEKKIEQVAFTDLKSGENYVIFLKNDDAIYFNYIKYTWYDEGIGAYCASVGIDGYSRWIIYSTQTIYKNLDVDED
jgi:hypothetical protein